METGTITMGRWLLSTGVLCVTCHEGKVYVPPNLSGRTYHEGSVAKVHEEKP